MTRPITHPRRSIALLLAFTLSLLSCSCQEPRIVFLPERAKTEADYRFLWTLFSAPIVHIEAGLEDSTQGSGVVLTGKDHTYVLSCHHLARSAIALGEPIRAIAYTYWGDKEPFDLKIMGFDDSLDLILYVVPDEKLLPGIRLSRSKVRQFQEVVLSSCPLGLDPTVTLGIVSDPSVYDDGRDAFMISAGACPGSSGGAVFDKETGDILGLYTSIFTTRFHLVYHMGLVVPVDRIIEWLQVAGYAHLLPEMK